MPFGHQFPQLLAHGFTLRDLLGSATRDDLFYTGIRYPRGGGTAGGDTARPRCPPSQPRVPLFGQAGAGVPPVGSRPGAAPRAWQGGSGATPGPRDVRWLWGHRRHLAASCATTGSVRKDNLGTSRMEEAGCSARSNKHPAAVPSAATSLQPKVQGRGGAQTPAPTRGSLGSSVLSPPRRNCPRGVGAMHGGRGWSSGAAALPPSSRAAAAGGPTPRAPPASSPSSPRAARSCSLRRHSHRHPPSLNHPHPGVPRPPPHSLTGAQAEAHAAQLPLGESLVVPEGELGARLGQVLGLEAVVHHGVVEEGAEAALHHPRLLPARLAVVGQHVAGGSGVSKPGPVSPRGGLFTPPFFSYHCTKASTVLPCSGTKPCASFTQMCSSPVGGSPAPRGQIGSGSPHSHVPIPTSCPVPLGVTTHLRSRRG